MLQSNLIPATVYRQEYLYTVDEEDTSLDPFQILFRALSVKELSFIRNLTGLNSHQKNIFVVEKSLITFINPTSKDISVLTLAQLDDIATKILKVSSMSEDMLIKLQLNASFITDKQFKTDTWNCEVCKSKGVDKLRNCRFSKTYKKDYDASFELYVGGVKYTDCPMYYKDTKVCNDMVTCYNTFEKGLFPEQGGLAEQTEFFTHAVAILANASNKASEKE